MSLPPPRPTKKRTRLQDSAPPLFQDLGYRQVPQDDEERDEAFKPYRLYARSLTGAWSKLLELMSDEPADEEERAAAIESFCLTCYQLNLTMLDWRLSLPLALGSPIISRLPAIQKKWKQKTQVEKEARPQQERPVEGVRLTPIPRNEGSA